MNVAGYVVVAVLVIAALGTVAFLPLGAPLSTSGSLSTSASTSTVRTSCSSSTATQVSSSTVNGTFTASSSQVRVDYVSATVYTDSSGQRTLRMEVGFTNIGSSDIYVPSGCGSSLNSTIVSGSGVVRTVQGAPRCLCAEFLTAVIPGQSRSEIDPGCWSSYSYQVVGPGAFTTKLSLSWFPDAQFNRPSGSITISATFTIPN